MADYSTDTAFPDTWEGIKERALALMGLFAASRVRLPPRSDLASHIDSTIEFIDARERGIPADVSDAEKYRVVNRMFRAWQLWKIADALLTVDDVATRVKYLRAAASGSVDAFDRKPSLAKDYLWELQLCRNLRKRGVAAALQEPDIVATIGGHDVGIACKKIYSESNISPMLSRAVKQITSRHEFGIVALDIVDLIGRERRGQRRVFKSTQQMQILLVMECRAFQQRHSRVLLRYLSTGRVMGALVNNGGLVECEGKQINAYAKSVWQSPNLAPRKQQVMALLQSLVAPEPMWVPDIVISEWNPQS